MSLVVRCVRRPIAITLAVCASLGLATARAAAQDDEGRLSAAARQQVQALLAEKESRTAAQAKIDSNLLYALRRSQGRPAAPGVTALEAAIRAEKDGTVVVDMVARVTKSLRQRIGAAGGKILSANERLRSIRARLPLTSLEALAADADVVFIGPRQDAITVGSQGGSGRAVADDDLKGVSPRLRPSLSPGFAARAARVQARLEELLGGNPDAINRSQGVVTHQVDTARTLFGASGAGVRIGILSNGVDSLAALQATGDVPAVTVLPGQAGTGNEGTAMLEIVHDLVPDAQLYYATALGGITTFAQNIRDLRTAGCDIIVDDVFYFVETPFQKGQAPTVISTTNAGVVIQAVNDVTTSGALYFSSAGNSGNKNDNTSGTWEGDFADGGAVAPPVTGAGNLHDFGGAVTQNSLIVGAGNPVSVSWSDPLGGSGNDYDLFVLNAAGTAVVAASTNLQTGTQDPYEQTPGTSNVTNNRVVVVKRTGAAARFLHVSTNRGRLTVNTPGQTHGHSSAVNVGAYGVAATPAIGPFPAPHGPTNTVETFSSDGLRHYFFNADGSPITPGDVSSTGGETVQKPDITAADGVSCAAPGFTPFFGTSAAAPHAGAIAGLLKSVNPSLTQAQIRGFLTSTAIDIEGGGVDRDSGAGIIDALAAARATGPQPFNFVIGTTTLAEGAGDGDTILEPGECGTLLVTLRNLHPTAGTSGISAVLSSATPGVTLDVASSTYPDIPAGGSAVNARAFRFRLDTVVSCPLLVDLVLTVTYTGGTSPQALPFRVRAGLPPLVIDSTLDATPPVVPPGAVTATTGSQTARIFRDGIARFCGLAKPFPGVSGAGGRQFDSYVFQNCSAEPKCIQVHLEQTSGATPDLFGSAYLTSFDPANLGTNYAADPGLSFAPGPAGKGSYSFNVPAGETFVVNVNEVNAGGGIGRNYRLTVDGLCLPCQSYSTSYSCCPAISFAPTTIPDGVVGAPYTATLTPSGGVGPYNFSVTGLPAGLSAAPASGTSVTISGTPTAAFSGTITVTGSDTSGCPFSQDYTLTITSCTAPSTTITAPDQVCREAAGLTASVPDAGGSATYAWTITNGTITSAADTRTITFSSTTGTPLTLDVAVTPAVGCPVANGSKSIIVTPGCYQALTPCRVIDTRNPTGPYGGPALQPTASRNFNFAAQCGIPADARALALNVTVTGPTAPGFLTLYPADQTRPLASTINFVSGRARANNSIVSVTTDGSDTVAVYNGAAGTVHLVVDVVGYFK
jgi:hypothetical protein